MGKAETVNKEKLFKLWAYDAEAKMWSSGKGSMSPQNLAIIENIQKKSENVRNELFTFIATVEDPYYRVLLNYRCIERRSWKDIARIIGGSPESHRMALSRFLTEN